MTHHPDLWAMVDGEASPALERASFDEVAESSPTPKRATRRWRRQGGRAA